MIKINEKKREEKEPSNDLKEYIKSIIPLLLMSLGCAVALIMGWNSLH